VEIREKKGFVSFFRKDNVEMEKIVNISINWIMRRKIIE
jgi:hypothetical protein